MSFFVDQPEGFSTINIIQGFLYKDIPVLWIIGGIFILVIFILLILKIKISVLRKNFTNILIFTALIFWSPLFINFFYNNVYDLKENLDLFKQDTMSKRITRYCLADKYQGLNGEFCSLIPFIEIIKETIPKKSTIKIASRVGNSAYFYYYDLHLLYNFTHDPAEADYVIVHYSPDYYYRDCILYQAKHDLNNLTEDKEVGYFSVAKRTGTYSVIFKKADN